jgi:glycosyltransferase involved in cell wall biosynthesis
MEDWFEELPRLLKHFPKFTHVPLVPQVKEKSEVLPVGCDLRRFDTALSKGRPPADGPPIILWNQRWEYDKAPRTFFRALCLLADEGLPFRVALAGKNYRQTAREFLDARDRLGNRVIHFGYAAPEKYGQLMHRADIVVSTAIHEFFGVSVVEAVYCGCFPVLPRRLVYPEIIPEEHHEACLYDDFDELIALLRGALSAPERARSTAVDLGLAVARYDWGHVAPQVDAALEILASRRPG